MLCNQLPASETTFEMCFTGEPLMARFYLYTGTEISWCLIKKHHQSWIYLTKCSGLVHVHDVISVVLENTRWVCFYIKFTRQGFENACWHREACRAIQHAFSKPSLVNLISKDANLVFDLSVYPLLNTLQSSDYGVIFDFCVDSAAFATSFKKCNVIMTW